MCYTIIHNFVGNIVFRNQNPLFFIYSIISLFYQRSIIDEIKTMPVIVLTFVWLYLCEDAHHHWDKVVANLCVECMLNRGGVDSSWTPSLCKRQQNQCNSTLNWQQPCTLPPQSIERWRYASLLLEFNIKSKDTRQ